MILQIKLDWYFRKSQLRLVERSLLKNNLMPNHHFCVILGTYKGLTPYLSVYFLARLNIHSWITYKHTLFKIPSNMTLLT